MRGWQEACRTTIYCSQERSFAPANSHEIKYQPRQKYTYGRLELRCELKDNGHFLARSAWTARWRHIVLLKHLVVTHSLFDSVNTDFTLRCRQQTYFKIEELRFCVVSFLHKFAPHVQWPGSCFSSSRTDGPRWSGGCTTDGERIRNEALDARRKLDSRITCSTTIIPTDEHHQHRRHRAKHGYIVSELLETERGARM